MQEVVKRLDRSTVDFPTQLRGGGLAERFPNLWSIGAVHLLGCSLLGLLCSRRCPGSVILKTYDVARALRDAAVPVIGGFHSPMEKECLELLLRGTQPVVVCPARSLERLRLPVAWKAGIEAQRVAVVSPFGAQYRRVTAALAQERNSLVGALAKEVCILHSEPGGLTERLCNEFVEGGKTVWTLDLPENAVAVQSGARPTTSTELAKHWKSQAVRP
jgi:predicted Rossmann fold nucleotide-binding protein DprA/Smf involved in DNA uptake